MSVLEQYGMFISSTVPHHELDVVNKYNGVIWCTMVTFVIGTGIVICLYRAMGFYDGCNNHQQGDEERPEKEV